MIEFLDPRAPTEMKVTPYTLGIDLDLENEQGLTVGFLANGFPDSVAFLEAVATALASKVDITTKHWNKGNASIPASPEILAEIKDSCHAVVAAYGH